MTRRILPWIALVLWLPASPAAAQSLNLDGQVAALAPTRPPTSTILGQSAIGDQTTRRNVTFRFRDRPSLRFGDVLRIDLRVRLHGDVRGFSPDLPFEDDEGEFEFTRRRLVLDGTFLRRVEFQIEREFADDDILWRDLYVNVRGFDPFEVRAGKFKIPFSLDRLTGTTDLDFIDRSLIADNLAPGRDRGVMVHGRLFDRTLSYEAGAFRGSGDDTPLAEPAGTARTYAVRVTTTLGVGGLDVGGALVSGALPEGLNSLAGQAASGFLFFKPVYARGRRLRLGAELSWTPGPFSIKGEYIRAQEDRLGQGLEDDDLPDALAQGWYLGGTWLITGENKGGSVTPRRPLFQGGAGALELTARIEEIRFGSLDHPDEPFRNPRATLLLQNRDRAFTGGVNWYLNRWVKLQTNATWELFEDPERTPILGRDGYWSWVFRLQFAM